MFFGTYKRNLDEKGRLQMPSKLLSADTKKLYVLKGFEGCLSIYEEKEFQEFASKLSGMDFFSSEQRDFVRTASASISELSVDSHGRISLGKQLLEDYGIKSDVTLIGVLDHLELWDSLSYAKYLAGSLKKYDSAGRNS